MNGFLIDTNLISELVKPRPEPKVVRWVDSIDENLLYLSVLTLGEVTKGLTVLPSSRRKTDLSSWLRDGLQLRFAGRILVVDDQIAMLWGRLAGEAKLRGQPISVVDGLVAATAIRHELQLATRNISDFSGLNVQLLNPWDTP